MFLSFIIVISPELTTGYQSHFHCHDEPFLSLYAYHHGNFSTNLSFLKPESHECKRTKRLAATFDFFTLISGINIDYFLAHFTCGKLMDFRYSLATNIFKISSQSCLLFSIILFLWPYCKAFLLVFFNFMWTVYRLVWSTIIKINQS